MCGFSEQSSVCFHCFSWWDTNHSNENFPEAQPIKVDKIEAALFKIGLQLGAELHLPYQAGIKYVISVSIYDPMYHLNDFQNHMDKEQRQLLITEVISQEGNVNSNICLLAFFFK